MYYNNTQTECNGDRVGEGEQMKAILNIRVSTSKQVEQGASLNTQEAKLRQYAGFHDFDQVEVIADEGLSGKTTARPGFQRLMDTMRAKGVDAVIVYSLSRFARNTIATLEAIEVMNRRGVAFHSLTENIDTTSPVGRFFLTTLAGLAQLEREQIGERTRAVLQHMKSMGERVGQIPFGSKDDNGAIIPDENEQAAIALIGKLRSEGLSCSAIATRLEQLDVRNKAGRPTWSKQQVHRIANRVS